VDGQTKGRTTYAHTDGHLRPDLLGPLCPRVDLKMANFLPN